MHDNKWLEVATVSSIKEGEYKLITLPEQSMEIIIFNIDNNFFAIENRCPHQNLPLADGFVEDNNIICPFHGAVFSLLTGEVKVSPDTACDNLTIFATKIENDSIKINVP